ncbi:MAG: lipopolysaccharide biosynthesis, partial [Cyanobacteria bacterium P01_D01_bin.73]
TLAGAINVNQRQQRYLRFRMGILNAQINSLEQRLGLSVDEAYASLVLSADPTIQELQQRLNLVEVDQRVYGRRLRLQHPVM